MPCWPNRVKLGSRMSAEKVGTGRWFAAARRCDFPTSSTAPVVDTRYQIPTVEVNPVEERFSNASSWYSTSDSGEIQG